MGILEGREQKEKEEKEEDKHNIPLKIKRKHSYLKCRIVINIYQQEKKERKRSIIYRL